MSSRLPLAPWIKTTAGSAPGAPRARPISATCNLPPSTSMNCPVGGCAASTRLMPNVVMTTSAPNAMTSAIKQSSERHAFSFHCRRDNGRRMGRVPNSLRANRLACYCEMKCSLSDTGTKRTRVCLIKRSRSQCRFGGSRLSPFAGQFVEILLPLAVAVAAQAPRNSPSYRCRWSACRRTPAAPRNCRSDAPPGSRRCACRAGSCARRANGPAPRRWGSSPAGIRRRARSSRRCRRLTVSTLRSLASRSSVGQGARVWRGCGHFDLPKSANPALYIAARTGLDAGVPVRQIRAICQGPT